MNYLFLFLGGEKLSCLARSHARYLLEGRGCLTRDSTPHLMAVRIDDADNVSHGELSLGLDNAYREEAVIAPFKTLSGFQIDSNNAGEPGREAKPSLPTGKGRCCCGCINRDRCSRSARER